MVQAKAAASRQPPAVRRTVEDCQEAATPTRASGFQPISMRVAGAGVAALPAAAAGLSVIMIMGAMITGVIVAVVIRACPMTVRMTVGRLIESLVLTRLRTFTISREIQPAL